MLPLTNPLQSDRNVVNSSNNRHQQESRLLSHPYRPNPFLESRNLLFSNPTSTINFPVYRFSATRPRLLPVRKVNASFDEPYDVSKSQVDGSIFEAFLSIIEFLCLASSAAMSAYMALSSGVLKSGILGSIGRKVLVWQCVGLASGAVIGAVIRRRQWRRICGPGLSRGSASYGVDFVGRVKKLEEDLRSSATMIRILSKHLEKLGNRVRVTRKTLKEPIAENAALAQRNSEVTRALAAQEDILVKELSEIQKILLSMQEQQQKQVELILAIAKGGKFWGSGQKSTEDQDTLLEASKSSMDQDPKTEVNHVKVL